MSISKLGMKRLHRLVKFMESLPKSANKHFDMSSYISHPYEWHAHKIPDNPTIKDLYTCGTTACVLGWAMTVPEFRKAGLRWDGQCVLNSKAVFGLRNEVLWEQLFGSRVFSDNDKTPKAWAKRVRKLLTELTTERRVK